MQWYNESTGALQSEDPGKGCFGDLLTERRAGWQQVSIDFRPPAKTPIINELIASLDAEYQPQFDALTLAWAKAGMDGNTTLAASIKADKDALLAEYTTKREAIVNG